MFGEPKAVAKGSGGRSGAKDKEGLKGGFRVVSVTPKGKQADDNAQQAPCVGRSRLHLACKRPPSALLILPGGAHHGATVPLSDYTRLMRRHQFQHDQIARLKTRVGGRAGTILAQRGWGRS
jgi:hypothetical protein